MEQDSETDGENKSCTDLKEEWVKNKMASPGGASQETDNKSVSTQGFINHRKFLESDNFDLKQSPPKKGVKNVFNQLSQETQINLANTEVLELQNEIESL